VDEALQQLQTAFADRYRIERELGRGGMATVYLAEDLKHGRNVAIKVLNPELAANLGAERFDREIRMAAQLQHPHIVSLYDSGIAEGFLYYVMPFVPGESLRDRLNRENQLPIDDTLQITLEVCDALSYAHSLGIVHRDIKPENIMLSGGHALVADFGIARAVASAETSKLTQTGTAIGTPLYMSPEQAVGDNVGATSDIYSLGCVMYEMLIGQPPFTGPNARAIMARHAMEVVPSLQVVRDTVPDEVEDAILAALAKTPADRPQTATQFAELLGVPLHVTAARRTTRSTATRRANTPRGQSVLVQSNIVLRRWIIGGAFATFLLILIGGGVAAWRLRSGGGSPIPSETGGLDRHHVAVLYFEDLSPKQELGYVADGLTDGLISELSGVQRLSVVSPGGVAQYRGTSVSRDSIARALQVGTLVVGSVEPENDSIRVTVRLLDDAGIELEKATFKKPAKDLVALSDSLSQQVALQIRRRIGEEVQLSRTRAGTRSTDAWSKYQRAVQARGRGDSLFKAGDADGFAREYRVADSMAALSETLDARWTDPIVLRGTLAYWRSRRASDDAGLAGKMIDVGLGHAQRALQLDPNDADALVLRGNLNYWKWLYPLEPDSLKRDRLLMGAEADLERATQLDPGNAGAYATLSHMYNNVPSKSGVDVVLAARTALEKDAYLSNADVILNRLVLGYYDLGQFPDADKWCREGQRRFPKAPSFVECQLLLMESKFSQPDPALAWKLADSLVQLTPDEQEQRYAKLNGRVLVAGVLARSGLKDSARAVLRNTKDDPEIDPSRDVANTAAFVWTLVGDTTEALNQLKAYLLANPARVADFRDNPNWWFRELANDPRYKRLVGATP
jgi:serine/threonine-protein kinase